MESLFANLEGEGNIFFRLLPVCDNIFGKDVNREETRFTFTKRGLTIIPRGGAGNCQSLRRGVASETVGSLFANLEGWGWGFSPVGLFDSHGILRKGKGKHCKCTDGTGK